MATKTDVDGMSAVILEEMNKYKDVTIEMMKDAVRATANTAVQKLKGSNPSGAGKYRPWTEYLNGWTATQENKKGNALSFKMIVHNEKKYRLAHLLENGHAMVNGGRARSFPHIKPVEEMCEKLLYQNIMERLEKEE